MIKYLLLAGCFLHSFFALAQADSIRKIEPNLETSFDSYEVLFMAILGLLLLIGLRFWFWKTRKR
jgi:hypothetical protein